MIFFPKHFPYFGFCPFSFFFFPVDSLLKFMKNEREKKKKRLWLFVRQDMRRMILLLEQGEETYLGLVREEREVER